MQMKGMPVTVWPGSSLPTCSLRTNSQRCWQSWRHPGQYHTVESNLIDLLVNPLYSICSSQFFPVNPSQLANKLWKKPLYPGQKIRRRCPHVQTNPILIENSCPSTYWSKTIVRSSSCDSYPSKKRYPPGTLTYYGKSPFLVAESLN